MKKKHPVKIISTERVTHNVKRFRVERPPRYRFVPGQATDVSIPKKGWENKLHPFTFTGLTEWEHLEFTIKIYPDHQGLTQQLGMLDAGDEILLHDVWGAIHYYDEGTFIAGGAGVTPFIAIFRDLEKKNTLGDNKLIFSSKTVDDIILKDEFSLMLGHNFINTLTEQKTSAYDNRKIDTVFLEEKCDNFSGYFYVCGPDPMVAGMKEVLEKLGAAKKKIIIEKF